MWVVQNTPEVQAPMISGAEDEPSPRKPFEFITNMFKRRRENDPHLPDSHPHHHHPDPHHQPHITLQGPEGSHRSWTHDTLICPPTPPPPPPPPATTSSTSTTATTSPTPPPPTLALGGEGGSEGGSSLHHTPVKTRDLGIDMEAIRLSRQDNPYLQRVADSLTEEEEAAEEAARRQREDTARLVAQESEEGGALTLSEVHEHLIRSPPPTSLPRPLPHVFLFPLDKSEGGSGGGSSSTLVSSSSVGSTINSVGRGQLKPLVTRQHTDVLDQHLRQILHTQRQLVVARPRPGEGGVSCSSVPASPAHNRSLSRRSPHARTLSEEATTVQGVGGASVGGVGGGSEGVMVGVLAPVLPPGRRQHSSDFLLNPSPSCSSSSAPTPTPSFLKPLSTKPKRGSVGGGSEGSGSTTALHLPIRYPHQPAAPSSLVDIT